MANVVSQNHFDEIVRENINDLEMSEEEAVADAIQQLEAQGVNLRNIIKDPRKVSEISKLVQALKEKTECSINDPDIPKLLTSLVKLLDEEISIKLYAASKGLYGTLIECVKCNNASVNRHALETLTVLMDGYPDLMNLEGVDILLGLLNLSTPTETILLALKWLSVCVKKHERIRASLIDKQIGDLLKQLLEAHKSRGDVVSAICGAMQLLTLDDDIRVEHGNAHEHARTLATQMLPLCTAFLPKFVSDADTTRTLLASITAMLVRNEFCIVFHQNDGVKYALDALMEHVDDPKVVRECYLVLKSLAGSDEVKDTILAHEASQLLIVCLEKHYKDINVAIAGCMCLAALSLRSPSNSRIIVGGGGAEALVKCLFHWKQNKAIMTHGCAAIRNQLSRCPELSEEYRNLDVEQLLKDYQSFEAKSVLSYLGCDVKLNEEWRGTGVQLQN